MRSLLRAVAAFCVTVLTFMQLATRPDILVDPQAVMIVGYVLGVIWAFAEVEW